VHHALRSISVIHAQWELWTQLKEFVSSLVILLIVLPVLEIYALNAISETLLAMEFALHAQSITVLIVPNQMSASNVIAIINYLIIPAFFVALPIVKPVILLIIVRLVLLITI
jgi:hypothetical protein